MYIASQATSEASKTWDQATPGKIHEEKKEAFESMFNENREALVNHFCQELAQTYLNERLSLQSIQDILDAHVA